MTRLTKILKPNWRWILAVPTLCALPAYFVFNSISLAIGFHLILVIAYIVMLTMFGDGFVIEGGCALLVIALLIGGVIPLYSKVSRLRQLKSSLQELPIVAITDVPPPAQNSVIIEPGSNLRAVGAKAYGHERFSGFVAAFNSIPDPEVIAAGTLLKTPSLAVAFRDAGMDSVYQPALNVLAKACTDYFDTLPVYLSARNSSNVTSGKFQISTNIQTKFLGLARSIEKALTVLKSTKPTHSAPVKAIAQYEQVISLLKTLATGEVDGYGYDSDLVGQRFGLAFTSLLIWTQQRHR